jgi:hypothetical protein
MLKTDRPSAAPNNKRFDVHVVINSKKRIKALSNATQSLSASIQIFSGSPEKR